MNAAKLAGKVGRYPWLSPAGQREQLEAERELELEQREWDPLDSMPDYERFELAQLDADRDAGEFDIDPELEQ